jgi:hypothetical protein
MTAMVIDENRNKKEGWAMEMLLTHIPDCGNLIQSWIK